MTGIVLIKSSASSGMFVELRIFNRTLSSVGAIWDIKKQGMVIVP